MAVGSAIVRHLQQKTMKFIIDNLMGERGQVVLSDIQDIILLKVISMMKHC